VEITNTRSELRLLGSKEALNEFLSFMAAFPDLGAHMEGERLHSVGPLSATDWIVVAGTAPSIATALVAYFKFTRRKFYWNGRNDTFKGEGCSADDFAKAVERIKAGYEPVEVQEPPPAQEPGVVGGFGAWKPPADKPPDVKPN
jgi:hypothetical protein